VNKAAPVSALTATRKTGVCEWVPCACVFMRVPTLTNKHAIRSIGTGNKKASLPPCLFTSHQKHLPKATRSSSSCSSCSSSCSSSSRLLQTLGVVRVLRLTGIRRRTLGRARVSGTSALAPMRLRRAASRGRRRLNRGRSGAGVRAGA
jgi:hypothetical protein